MEEVDVDSQSVGAKAVKAEKHLSDAELTDILRAVLVLERMDRALDERVAPIIGKCLPWDTALRVD